MSTQPRKPSEAPILSSADLGAKLVALAGVGLIGYGVLFLLRNFSGFIEIGLTPDLAGGTPEAIAAFSPQLYDYISHIQVALAGVIIGLGIAVVALAWFGIRSGQRWALVTALVAPIMALAVGLPLHYVYGLATFWHLGPIFLDVALLLAGCVIAYRTLKA